MLLVSSKVGSREERQRVVRTQINIKKKYQLIGLIAKSCCTVLIPIYGVRGLYVYAKGDHIKKGRKRNETGRVVEEGEFCNLSDGDKKLNPEVLFSVNIGRARLRAYFDKYLKTGDLSDPSRSEKKDGGVSLQSIDPFVSA